MNSRFLIARLMAMLGAIALLAGVFAAPAAADGELPPPENLEVADVGSHHVTVTWDSPPNVDQFLVEATIDGLRDVAAITDDTVATFFLEPGTQYELRVRSRWNSEGDNSEWVTANVRTDDGGSVPVAQNVEVVENVPGVVRVAWDAPLASPNVLTYRVRTEVEGQSWALYEWVSEPEVTLYLDHGKAHEVSVLAVPTSPQYRAEYSEPVPLTTPPANPTSTPGNVELATSPGAINVTWDASTSPIGIDSYEVTLIDDFRMKRVTTTNTSAQFAIPNGGPVDVTVRAQDVAGRWSDPSATEAVVVPPQEGWEPLTAPANLTAEFNAETREMHFEWDAATGGVPPYTYHMYLDGTEIERTSELFFDSSYFRECDGAGDLEAEIFMTARSQGVESPASNAVTVCF